MNSYSSDSADLSYLDEAPILVAGSNAPALERARRGIEADLLHLRVPVSSLCIAAAVPATTALRWLKAIVDQGLFVRRADPHVGRRVFVELLQDTSLALHPYFVEVERTAVI